MPIVKHFATGRDIHIDAALSNLSVAYRNTSFLAEEIFPIVKVGKQSDVYYVFNKGDWFRIEETLRAKTTEPRKVEFAVSSSTYYARGYALEEYLAWEDLKNADAGIDFEASSTEHLTDLLKLALENRIASMLTSGTNVGSYATLTGDNQWSAYTTSDPFNDVAVGKDAIHATTGKQANFMVISYPVYIKLREHPDILDRIKYTQVGIATVDLLAKAFDIENVMIGAAVKNTGAEGLADSFSYVWGKDVLIGYRAKTPGLREASLGYNFRWVPEGFRPMTVAKIEDEHKRARIVSVEYYQDEKITGSDCGYLIEDAIA